MAVCGHLFRQTRRQFRMAFSLHGCFRGRVSQETIQCSLLVEDNGGAAIPDPGSGTCAISMKRPHVSGIVPNYNGFDDAGRKGGGLPESFSAAFFQSVNRHTGQVCTEMARPCLPEVTGAW